MPMMPAITLISFTEYVEYVNDIQRVKNIQSTNLPGTLNTGTISRSVDNINALHEKIKNANNSLSIPQDGSVEGVVIVTGEDDYTKELLDLYHRSRSIMNIWNTQIGVIDQISVIHGIAEEGLTIKEASVRLYSSVNEEALYREYLDYLEQNPSLKGNLSNHKQGTYQIIYDMPTIQKVHLLGYKRLLSKGIPHEQALNCSRPSIAFKDNFWKIVRDAVISPSGVEHTYNRMIQGPGAAILALDTSGEEITIVMNIEFRHATRDWELAIPRGGAKVKKNSEVMESGEETAERELLEETGYLLTAPPELLGRIVVDSGVLNSSIPLYIGYINTQVREEPKRDKTEAIAESYGFSLSEIDVFLEGGFLAITRIIDGEEKTVDIFLRDPFLLSALMMARAQGLLEPVIE